MYFINNLSNWIEWVIYTNQRGTQQAEASWCGSFATSVDGSGCKALDKFQNLAVMNDKVSIGDDEMIVSGTKVVNKCGFLNDLKIGDFVPVDVGWAYMFESVYGISLAVMVVKVIE